MYIKITITEKKAQILESGDTLRDSRGKQFTVIFSKCEGESQFLCNDEINNLVWIKADGEYSIIKNTSDVYIDRFNSISNYFQEGDYVTMIIDAKSKYIVKLNTDFSYPIHCLSGTTLSLTNIDKFPPAVDKVGCMYFTPYILDRIILIRSSTKDEINLLLKKYENI